MKLINLTPHDIKVGDMVIPASGEIARMNVSTMDAGQIEGISIVETRILGFSGIPEPAPDTAYIVPSMVRVQFPKRRDLLSPSKFLRDRHGSITGCLGLEINPEQ